MATIAVQSGKTVMPVNDYVPIMRTFIAGVSLTTGQLVKIDTNGKVIPTAATTETPVGIVVGSGGGAGYPVSVVQRGVVDGFDISALAYPVAVYTGGAGGLLDSAGTIAVGRVVPMS